MTDAASTTMTPELPAEPAAEAPVKAARDLERRWGKTTMSLGFVYVPSVILRAQPRLKIDGTELSVLIHLLDHWWSSAEMPFPSKRRLAERLMVSEKTIQRAIARLEAEGLVRRLPRHHAAGGQASNFYDLSPVVERVREIAADMAKAREEARATRKRAERPGMRRRSKAAAEVDE